MNAYHLFPKVLYIYSISLLYLKILLQAISSVGADIIAIQECYEKAHSDFIYNSLKSQYPYKARVDSGNAFSVVFSLFNLFLNKYLLFIEQTNRL
jgi:hypothetical protein